MRLSHTKKSIVAVLLGIVFLLGGVGVVSAAGPAELEHFSCGISLKNFVSLDGCLPIWTYYLFYKPASFILVGGAYVFDAIITLSIDSKFIQQDFIESSWKVVRDFSNMAFIFILLYTGIQTMLGLGNWRKTVLNVIVIALLINFSLFFTKVVIDAGNVLAVGIYEITGQKKTGDDKHVSPGGSVDERDISFRIAAAFEPQEFVKITAEVEPMDAIIIFIIAGVVSAFAGYIFFKVALVFIGRLIGFWFLMIISPFAFISVTFPKGNKFQEWLDALLSQAFVAPVFLFFIYLIIRVIDSKILKDITTAPPNEIGLLKEFTFHKVLLPVIVATLIIMALKFALEYAEKMAGDFGKLGAKMGGAVMGVAGGVALGGGALALRSGVGAVGALGNKVGLGGAAGKLANSNSAVGRWVGRQGITLADKAKTGSFDVRQSTGFIGKNINKGLTAAGIGTKTGIGAFGIKDGKGGYAKESKDREQARKDAEHKGAERAEMTEREKEEFKNEASAKAEEALASATLQEKTATEQLTAQMKASADAQKAHDESATAKAKNAAGVEYEEAVRNRMRGGTSDQVDKAKAKFEAAENTHASSATSTAVTVALDKLKLAEEARGHAREAVTTATKAKDEVLTKADDAIKTENGRRREQYAKDTAWTSPGTWVSSENERADRVARIRGGRTDEEKAAAKKRATKDEGSDIDKLFKKAVEAKAEENKKHAVDGGGSDHGKTVAHASPAPAAHAAPAATHTAAPATPSATTTNSHGGGH